VPVCVCFMYVCLKCIVCISYGALDNTHLVCEYLCVCVSMHFMYVCLECLVCISYGALDNAHLVCEYLCVCVNAFHVCMS
jgi:hypothetical protein